MNKLLSPSEKIIVYILFALLFLGVNIVFIFEPVFKENRMLNDRIKVTMLKTKKYLRLLKEEKYIRDKYAKLNLKIPAVEKLQSRLVSTLSVLEDTAQKANVQIIDLRPEINSESAQDKAVVIDLKAEAPINEFVNFIYGIENSQLLLTIKKFQLNARPNSQILDGIFLISAD